VTEEPTYKCLDAVKEFHRLIGVVPDPASPAQAALRTRVILEEYAETYVALQERNIIEAADGLADLRYVVLGTAAVYDILLPDDTGWGSVLPLVDLDPDHALNFGGLFTQVGGVILALRPPVNTTTLSDSLRYLDAAVSRFAWTLGIPLDRVFWEVHASNMSKQARSAGTDSKYGGVDAKGPGYQPPDVAAVLGIGAAR
jgi:Phosphoribosyl-ATP pyrophosphohydrolase